MTDMLSWNVIVERREIRASFGDQYAGTGKAEAGAPRVFLGTNTPSGDDSAVLIGRNVKGEGLFSHGIRDESTFESSAENDSYTPFDAAPTIKGTNAKYGHTHGFQYRANFAGAGSIDQMAAFITDPICSSGHVQNVFGLKVNDTTGEGAVTHQYGVWINPLTKGESANYAVFVAGDNPSYFGGRVDFAKPFLAWDRSSIEYGDHEFKRGLTIRNRSGSPTSVCGMTLTDVAGFEKAVFDYYDENFANPEIANTATMGTIGDASIGFIASVNESAKPDIFFKIGSNPKAMVIHGKDNSVDVRRLCVEGKPVVGERQAGIPNAGKDNIAETLNKILAALRAHGLIEKEGSL